MNDNLAKVSFTKKEIVTNPQKVFFALLCKPNARSHPGVDEKVITTSEGRSQTAKESEMAFG